MEQTLSEKDPKQVKACRREPTGPKREPKGAKRAAKVAKRAEKETKM